MDHTPLERFTTREVAVVEVYGKNGHVIASVRNLSGTGACLEWANEGSELKEGDLVRITIVLKALNRRHHVNAEVVWRSGNRSGVSFIPSNQVLDRLLEKSA